MKRQFSLLIFATALIPAVVLRLSAVSATVLRLSAISVILRRCAVLRHTVSGLSLRLSLCLSAVLLALAKFNSENYYIGTVNFFSGFVRIF